MFLERVGAGEFEKLFTLRVLNQPGLTFPLVSHFIPPYLCMIFFNPFFVIFPDSRTLLSLLDHIGCCVCAFYHPLPCLSEVSLFFRTMTVRFPSLLRFWCGCLKNIGSYFKITIVGVSENKIPLCDHLFT